MAERWRWSLGLAVLVVAIIVGVSLGLGANLGGTDDLARQAALADGYHPWFSSVLTLTKPQEIAMFALQGGLGGAVLGYVLGALREGRPASRQPR
ncbi:MAG: energy-coupling factor ABC transporter substrate-binding protein [Actinobacteria bacterium]|nr:energy-coupling factor ABC transporter substrate-binding protein [Actinomycetota bacterium]